jgi:hypothetical protein
MTAPSCVCAVSALPLPLSAPLPPLGQHGDHQRHVGDERERTGGDLHQIILIGDGRWSVAELRRAQHLLQSFRLW